jgi:hypothetical protein
LAICYNPQFLGRRRRKFTFQHREQAECVFEIIGLRVGAGIAQLVEQLICNQQVAGSSPVASSRFKARSAKLREVRALTFAL